MPRILTKEQVAEVCRRYIAGEPAPSIAADFGVTKHCVYGQLKRRGIARRVGAKKRVLSESQVDRICREYQRGISTTRLAPRYDVSPWAINSALYRRGIRERHGLQKLTPDNIEEICKRYEQGESAPKLAEKFGVCFVAVKHHLLKRGISLRSPKEYCKMLWQDSDYIHRVMDGISASPNKPELLLCQLTPESVKFTGDRSFWRTLPGGRVSNPDFIVEPVEDTRKVIFFHGSYWHRDETHDRGQKLVDSWHEIGYDCLIVWEDELSDLNAVLQKLSSFIEESEWQLCLPIR